MEILNIVLRYFNISNKSTKIILGGLFALIVAVNFLSFILIRIFNPIFLISHLLLYAIILIWILTAPYSLKLARSLDQIFENREYQYLCNWFHRREYLLRHPLSIFFTISWFIISFIIVFSLSLPTNFTWYTPQVLLMIALSAIALFLNTSSYYRSVLWSIFIFRVSKINVHLFSLNPYIPSYTSSLHRLYQTSTSSIFLITALLFTVQYALHQATCIDASHLYFMKVIHIVLSSVFLLLFGLFTFILISLWPRFSIQRIYKKWVSYQLITLETNLHNFEHQEKTLESLVTLQRMQILIHDKFTFHFSALEFFIAITTLCANLLGIISTISSLFYFP